MHPGSLACAYLALATTTMESIDVIFRYPFFSAQRRYQGLLSGYTFKSNSLWVSEDMKMPLVMSGELLEILYGPAVLKLASASQ